MISKKAFCDAVTAIVGQLARTKEVERHLEALSDGWANFDSGPALEGLICLLEVITQDKSEWLRYWLYELEEGAKYKPSSVTIDGKIVKLKTVGDLYRILKAGFGK